MSTEIQKFMDDLELRHINNELVMLQHKIDKFHKRKIDIEAKYKEQNGMPN